MDTVLKAIKKWGKGSELSSNVLLIEKDKRDGTVYNLYVPWIHGDKAWRVGEISADGLPEKFEKLLDSRAAERGDGATLVVGFSELIDIVYDEE